MESKPTLDRTILIPAAIGVLSVIGICLVLLIGTLTARSPQVENPTETPFKYVFLGTEPGTSAPTLDDTQIALTENPETPTSEEPIVLPTRTPSKFTTPSPIILPSRVVSPTLTRVIISRATSTLTPTLSPNIDDIDSRFLYDGVWTEQINVAGAFQGTLHISNTLNDKVTINFRGQQFSYFYQAGPSLGTVQLKIDALSPFSISQAQATTQTKRWDSGILVNGNHTIVITHDSGGSVNVDSIIIVTGATPTPTLTLTSTP